MAGTTQAPGGVSQDASGEVQADGRNDYLYDGDGRICAVKDLSTGAMTGYIYNADGQRVAKGTITAWSCNPSANGFATTNDYVLGPGGEQVTEMAVSGSTITWAWDDRTGIRHVSHAIQAPAVQQLRTFRELCTTQNRTHIRSAL